MDDAQFWSLIEQSRLPGIGCEAQADRLSHLLTSLPPEEIYDFDRHFDRRRSQSYRWDLWAVVYIINDGCSDDSFEYFRCWLIGQGQKAFEAALANPETVADLMPDEDADLECEDLWYAANYAYEKVTGTEMPVTDIRDPTEPLGEPLEPDEFKRRFPKLCARFS